MHRSKKRQRTKDTLFFEKSPPVHQRKRFKTEVESKPLDLSQTPLLEKINIYLKKMGRKNDDGSDYQISTRGYCHGLTLLFLEKMDEGKVQWFYDTKRKIIECEDSQLEEMELEIEKFLAMIEWAQNPEKYTQRKIRYFNVDLVLDTKPQQSSDNLYTFTQLKNFLTYKQGKGNMICLTNCYGDSKEHSVGIFTDGVHYHLLTLRTKPC